jgi:hypothetical protein
MIKIYAHLIATGFSFDQANKICEGIYVKLEMLGLEINEIGKKG